MTMGAKRITYALTLAAAIVFHALYPYWISWYLFVLILIIIPFDFIISLPGMLSKRISAAAPRIAEQYADGKLVITTSHGKRYPAGYIKVKLRIICDDFTLKRKVLCDPESGSRYEIKIDTSRSGVTVFEIERINNTSLFGLFSIPIAIERKAAVLVLPAAEKPPRIVSLPRGIILRPKPGGGFSEDSELRPYRAGDPVKSIHWKLSAKYDSLVIREPLIPPPHSRLVQIMHWSDPRERDTILGRFRWISDYLLKWELPFCVKSGDDGPVEEITCSEDFIEYLFHTLHNTEQEIKTPVSLPAAFSWVFRVDAKEAAQ